MLITCVMQNARAHKLQWSDLTVHSSTVVMVIVVLLTVVDEYLVHTSDVIAQLRVILLH